MIPLLPRLRDRRVCRRRGAPRPFRPAPRWVSPAFPCRRLKLHRRNRSLPKSWPGKSGDSIGCFCCWSSAWHFCSRPFRCAILISFLFLAITLYILQRPGHETSPDVREAGKKSPLRIYWLLPVLFAFWVNLDGWWILGPATVALYLIGQALQQLLAPIRTGEDVPP